MKNVRDIDNLEVEEPIRTNIESEVDLPNTIQEWLDLFNEIAAVVPKDILWDKVHFDIQSCWDYEGSDLIISCYYWRPATELEKRDYLADKKRREERQREIDLQMIRALKERYPDEA